MSTHQNCHHQCLCPHSELQPSPASAGDPPIPAGRSAPGSYEAIAFFPWVLMNMRCCVWLPRGEFLSFPPSPVEFLQTPLAFKARFSGGSSSHCQTPRVASLTWGSELSLLWENFCGIIIFQFVACPPGCMGFDFVTIAPLLPSHCGFFFVFGCRITFLVGSSIFLLMVVQQLVLILVFL